jgi:hypothetical protein
MYNSSYPGSGSDNDPYIAIDVLTLALKLKCKPELLFGRLYYVLDYKHRYRQENGALVPLFYLKVEEKRHAVNFPYLAGILAGHNEEHLKLLWSLGLSIVALVLSVGSLAVSIVK